MSFNRRNVLMATLVGLVVAAILLLQPYAWFHPAVWNDVAAGAGVRPPPLMVPGLGRLMMAGVIRLFGMAHAVVALRVLGALAAVLLAVFTYFLLAESLPKALRRRLEEVGYGAAALNRLLAVGTLFFLCNTAVWRALQGTSVMLLYLLLLVVALFALLRFLNTARICYVYLSMGAWGVFAADSSLGAAGGLVSWGFVWWKSLNSVGRNEGLIGNPQVRLTVHRRMSALFVGLFGLVVGLNIWLFCRCGGVRLAEAEALDLVFRYFREYGYGLVGNATTLGWALTLVLIGAPLLVLRRLTRSRAPTRIGLALFVLLAWSQTSGFSLLWFRSWIKEPVMISSELMVAMCGLGGALALVWSLVALAAEIHARNDARVSHLYSWVLPVLLALSVLPMCRRVMARRMVAVVSDYCFQTERECGDAKWIFTDGTLDTGLELAALADGRRIYPISVFSRRTPHEAAIRRRGATNEVDSALLESGATATLRQWIDAPETRQAEFALQIGNEMWKRRYDLSAMRIGGLLARPKGLSFEMAAKGTLEAHKMADQILWLHGMGNIQNVDDWFLRECFLFVQWRVARMSRLRSEVYAKKDKPDQAAIERRYVQMLDAANISLQQFKRHTAVDADGHSSLAPRDGLKRSLDRSDFKLAETFARNVLSSDPDDSLANFALAMRYFFASDYDLSEKYLKKVLVRKPDDVNVLNNLAVVKIRQRRYDEAIAYAERALKVTPDSSEIKRTLANAKRLRDKAEVGRRRLKGAPVPASEK